MKNYFNAEERSHHIVLLAVTEDCEKFAQSTALTPEESKLLKKIHKHLTEFNATVFDRFGEAYARKIINTMACNNLTLVGKYAKQEKAISESAVEDLHKMLPELHSMNCLFCERENHKDCALYNMSVACDCNGNGKESGCPFKVEPIADLEEDI